MNHYVYEITNLVNGKKYIGKRSCNCPIEDDKYMGSGKYLKNAIKKYGKENFKKTVLEICVNEKDAFDREEYYINTFNAHINSNYYNISSGGDGGRGNFVNKTTSEMADIYGKISEKNKGHKRSYGRKLSIESRKKISDAHKGKKIPLDVISKRAEYIKKKVIELNTEIIFNSIKEASATYNISAHQIGQCCKGKAITAGNVDGYTGIWMYYDDYLNSSKSDIEKKLNKKRRYGTGSPRPLQRKQVICLNTLEIFDSIKAAAEKYGKENEGTISRCCRNKASYSCRHLETNEKLTWMYLSDYNTSNKAFIDNKLTLALGVKIILINTLEVMHIGNISNLNNIYKTTTSNILKCCKQKIKYSGKINGEPAKWMYYDEYLKQIKE